MHQTVWYISMSTTQRTHAPHCRSSLNWFVTIIICRQEHEPQVGRSAGWCLFVIRININVICNWIIMLFQTDGARLLSVWYYCYSQQNNNAISNRCWLIVIRITIMLACFFNRWFQNTISDVIGFGLNISECIPLHTYSLPTLLIGLNTTT